MIEYQNIDVVSTCNRVKDIMSNSANKPGSIYGVFSKAIYVRLDNKLITLTSGQSNFSYGVILRCEDLSFFKKVCSQDTVYFSNDCIKFPKQFIKLDFSEAAAWVPRPFPSRSVNCQQVLHNLEVLKMYLTNASVKDGLVDIAKYIDLRCRPIMLSRSDDKNVNPYCQASLPVLASIEKNWSLGLYEDAMFSANKLVGLGPGLTPSGDDFLVGMMSSIYGGLGLCPSIKMRLVQSLKLFATPENNITTEISRDLLQEASIGKVPENLYDLAYALFFGDGNDTANCAKYVAEIGATSGLDMILGAFFGGSLMIKLIEYQRM